MPSCEILFEWAQEWCVSADRGAGFAVVRLLAIGSTAPYKSTEQEARRAENSAGAAKLLAATRVY